MNSNRIAMTAGHDVTATDSEPSTRLRFVAGYFTVAGALSSLGFIFILGLVFIGKSAPLAAAIAKNWWSIPQMLLMIATQFWTGSALRNQRRAGWYGAVAAMGIPLLAMFAQADFKWFTVTTCVLGLILVVSVRRELQ